MLQQAVNFFNEGKTEEAEYLFREILKTQPKNIEANHFLAPAGPYSARLGADFMVAGLFGAAL